MSRKPKFKPEIIRIKLNPEQAVLVCNCFDSGSSFATSTARYWDERHLTTWCTASKTRGSQQPCNSTTNIAHPRSNLEASTSSS